MKVNRILGFRYLLICSFVGLFVSGLTAQDKEQPTPEGVYLTARVIDGYVELRWSPGNAALWRHANQSGYLLERMEMGSGQWEQLTESPIRPYTKEIWAAQTNPNDPNVVVASRAILEPPVLPATTAGFEEWKSYENEENGIFFFFLTAANLSAQASMGAGLRHEDRNIEAGKSYVYRISIPNWNGTETTTNFAVVEDTEQRYEAPQVNGIRVVEQESGVRIYWPANNQELFPAFHVERSVNGRDYERLNRLPLLFSSRADEFHFTDSVANYEPYYYRVVGATPFGDEGQPSEVAKAQGRDLTPPPPVMKTTARGDRQAVEVKWTLAEKTDDLAGFLIGRSGNINGPFQMLTEQPLSSTTRRFTDDQPKVFEPYYVVYTVDTASNINPAFAVMAGIADQEAPASPLGLEGVCDTSGLITLNWQANREEDLLGYHIYTANGKTDVYLPITGRPIQLTEWMDTVNMRALNRSVFYKITAVDYNNNPSDYSEIIEVKRPDVIAPAAPMIYDFTVVDDYIELHWYGSSSDDISRYQLTRHELSDQSTSVLLTFSANEAIKNYRDEDLESHQTYTYQLVAIDEAGHETTSEQLEVSTGLVDTREGVSGWNVSLEGEQQIAHLRWETLPDTKDAPRYVVYRAVPGKQLRTYRSFAADETAFEDYLPLAGAYRYALKVIWPDGSESPMSKIIEVER